MFFDLVVNPTVTTFTLWKCKLVYVRTDYFVWGEETIETLFPTVTRNDCHDMVKLERTTGYYKEKLHAIPLQKHGHIMQPITRFKDIPSRLLAIPVSYNRP